MIIGLTGGIGSGKTTVANFFSAYNNVAIYIADTEAKKLMNSSLIIKQKLIKEFGEESYLNNKLNRSYISNIVFKDSKKLSNLNAIVHPEVKKNFQNFVKENSHKLYIIYENAILFETNVDDFCDFIISVFSDKETRLQRVLKRDSVHRIEILNRMNNQWKEDKKILQSNYIIVNKNLQNSKAKVNQIHNILTKKQGLI